MNRQDLLPTLRLLLGICVCWVALSILSAVAAQNITSLGLLSFMGLIVGMMLIPDTGT